MDILPEKKTIEQIFTSLNTKYKVPEYQRDYSWTINEEIDELWNDIITSSRSQSEYFMGTIVLNSENHNTNQFDIVDGQQRLATFTILLSVIYSIFKNFNNILEILPNIDRNEDNQNIASRITEITKIKLFYPGYPNNYYMELNQKDQAIFQAEILRDYVPLFSDEDLKIIHNESRIKKAKKYFFKKFKEEFSTINDCRYFLDLITHISQKLLFIVITVKSDYDAYLLFESLNSKGMDLSTSDLLKNKMLMVSENQECDKKRILDNWDEMVNAICENTRFSTPVEFIRFYWLAFYDKNVTRKELYKKIKDYIIRPECNIEKFSNEMLTKTTPFVEILDKDLLWPSTSYQTGDIKEFYAELNTLKYTICIPALMKAFFEKEDIFQKLVYNSIVYLFRLITVGNYSVGIASNTFNKIIEYIDNGQNSNTILSLFQQDNDKISDDIFRSNILQNLFKDNNIAKYIILKYNAHCHGTDQVPNVNDLHLEHILPQTPTHWLENGFDSREVHIDNWIYRIGNMTVVNWRVNSAISNRLYEEKLQRYQDCPIKITSSIAQNYTEWTADNITSRSNDIANAAPEIWNFDI